MECRSPAEEGVALLFLHTFIISYPPIYAEMQLQQRKKEGGKRNRSYSKGCSGNLNSRKYGIEGARHWNSDK